MATKKQQDERDEQGVTPDEVREEAVEVFLGEKPAEEASEAALVELANPTEVREAEKGHVVGGVRPGVTLPETESHPATPSTWDEQSIAEFQQRNRAAKQD